uniref:Uncharacterized protein n=1 Tax=Onchocerca volvulus TaxID=6282 RepID=A0A8R1XXL8_ONCVO
MENFERQAFILIDHIVSPITETINKQWVKCSHISYNQIQIKSNRIKSFLRVATTKVPIFTSSLPFSFDQCQQVER